MCTIMFCIKAIYHALWIGWYNYNSKKPNVNNLRARLCYPFTRREQSDPLSIRHLNLSSATSVILRSQTILSILINILKAFLNNTFHKTLNYEPFAFKGMIVTYSPIYKNKYCSLIFFLIVSYVDFNNFPIELTTFQY